MHNAIGYSSSQEWKNAVLAVNRAMALWIGVGVNETSFDGGYLM